MLKEEFIEKLVNEFEVGEGKALTLAVTLENIANDLEIIDSLLYADVLNAIFFCKYSFNRDEDFEGNDS